MKNIKRTLGHSVSAIALSVIMSGPALAADDIEAPAFTERWEGLYVGGHLGKSRPNDFTSNSIDSDQRIDGNLMGGLQAGYNWQDGDIVWGVQADISATGMTVGDPDYIAADAKFMGSIRGRLGLVLGDHLVYGTGGVGYVSGEAYSSSTPAVRERFGETVFVAGAGVEHAVDDRMSLGLEALYFGDTGSFTDDNGTDTMSFDGIWSARVFMNVRLDGAGSVFGADAIDPETYDLARWDGLYIGGHFGKGMIKDASCDCTTTEPMALVDGFVGGMQVGHNWQDGDIVWGVEGDVSGTYLWAGEFSEAFAEVDYLASIRGRLGMDIGQALVYATGGLGVIAGGTAHSDEPHSVLSFVETTYVVGGGIEIPIDDRVSFGAEGLFYGAPGRLTAGPDPDFVDMGGIWTARATLNVKVGG